MTKRKQKKTNFCLTEVNISKMQSLQKIAASSNSKSIGIHGVSMSSNENRKFDFFLHESTFPCLLAMLGNILHVWLAHLTLQLNWESQHLKTRERFETMKQVVQCIKKLGYNLCTHQLNIVDFWKYQTQRRTSWTKQSTCFLMELQKVVQLGRLQDVKVLIAVKILIVVSAFMQFSVLGQWVLFNQ